MHFIHYAPLPPPCALTKYNPLLPAPNCVAFHLPLVTSSIACVEVKCLRPVASCRCRWRLGARLLGNHARRFTAIPKRYTSDNRCHAHYFPSWEIKFSFHLYHANCRVSYISILRGGARWWCVSDKWKYPFAAIVAAAAAAPSCSFCCCCCCWHVVTHRCPLSSFKAIMRSSYANVIVVCFLFCFFLRKLFSTVVGFC